MKTLFEPIYFNVFPDEINAFTLRFKVVNIALHVTATSKLSENLIQKPNSKNKQTNSQAPIIELINENLWKQGCRI